MCAKRGANIWDRLIGPVLLCDLLRLTRRGSTTIFLARGLYLGLMLLVIVIFCGMELGLTSPAHFFEAFRAGFPVAANKAASFAAHFFFVLLGAQLAMVVLLTPAYVAGAIAEDRERRIIDYLLVSDLSNREIVLGKYLSRLAHLGLLLLTGAPLLAVAQVLGGVHPVFLLTGLVVALMTMISVGAVSIFVSLTARRPSQAILLTYLLVCLYLLFSTGFILSNLVLSTRYSDRIVELICFGNPLMPMVRLGRGMGDADWPRGVLITNLTICAIVHGVVTTVYLGLSIRCLRWHLTAAAVSREERFAQRLQMCRAHLEPETARQLAASTGPRPTPPVSRPSVSEQPILWKELHVEPPLFRWPLEMSTLFSAVVRILAIIYGSTFPLVLVFIRIMGRPSADLASNVHGFSTILVCLLMAGVAVCASSCLSGERERNTLDALLVTDLTNAAIINGKWLASLLKMRWCALLLAIVWGTSNLVGILDARSLLLLFLVAVILACCAASLGVFCSLLCRDTWRATVLALGLLLALGTFPWLLGWDELTPVGMLRALIEPARWHNRPTMGVPSPVFARVLSSIFVYSVLAVLLWSGTHFFFPCVTRRMPVARKRGCEQHGLADSR